MLCLSVTGVAASSLLAFRAANAYPLSKFEIHDLILALCSTLRTCIAHPGNSFKSRLANSSMVSFLNMSVLHLKMRLIHGCF